MKQVNWSKVTFYKETINLAVRLIEERTGNSLHTIDAPLENRIETAIEYGNLKDLKALHEEVGAMYESIKKRY